MLRSKDIYLYSLVLPARDIYRGTVRGLKDCGIMQGKIVNNILRILGEK